MKDKLKAWAIHKLGGLTKAEVKKEIDEAWDRVDKWARHCEELQRIYGRAETMHVVRELTPGEIKLLGPELEYSMLIELVDMIQRSKSFVVTQSCEKPYEGKMRCEMCLTVVKCDAM